MELFLQKKSYTTTFPLLYFSRDGQSFAEEKNIYEKISSNDKEDVPRAMNRRLYPLVFIVSFSILFIEITLTRFFSFLFSYHYIFLVVSLAILGLGIGASLIHFKPKLLKNPSSILPFFSLSFIALPFLLTGRVPPVLFILGGIGFIPFFLAGLFLTRTYHQAPNKFLLYFLDLCGAATGALVTVYLLERFGLLYAFGLMGIILFFITFPAGFRPLKSLPSIISLFFSLYLVFSAKSFLAPNLSSDKVLTGYLNSGAKILDSRWNTYARTDLVEIKTKHPSLYIFTDGEGATAIPEFTGTFDLANFQQIHNLVFSPFHFGKIESALIIGPGGGQEVLASLAAGVREINAVEINPTVIQFLQKTKEINGRLLDYKNIRWIVGEGRRFLEKTTKKYDLIYLPLVYTQSPEAITHSLVENYVFTKEAFRTYLSHLKEGGKLVILNHSTSDLIRSVTTALEVFMEKDKSISEGLKHITVIHQDPEALKSPEEVRYPLLMVFKDPLSSGRSQEIMNQILPMGYLPYFVPYYFEQGFLGLLSEGQLDIQEFYQGVNMNIRPVTDDSPYFYEMRKNIPPPFLFLLFLTLGPLGILFIILGRQKQLPVFLYFFLTGAGFMLIEIPLIQKFMLPLGYPILSFSIVLFGILLWGGIGSLWGEFLFQRGWKLRIFLFLPLVVFSFLILNGAFLSFLFQRSLIQASIIILFSLSPIAFLMGIPFPLGLHLTEKRGSSIALAWATSSISSVFGATLSMVLSLKTGFSLSLAVGGLSYLLVLPVLPFFLSLKSLTHEKEKTFREVK